MSAMPEAIRRWLATVHDPMPLQATSSSNASSSLLALLKQHPQIQATNIEAMLWLRVGFIDPAHGIVQEGRNDIEKYLHGIVHRLEGDFWNANYWFRQVRDRDFLQGLGEAIASGLESAQLYDAAIRSGIVEGRSFHAQRLVEAYEKHITTHSHDELQRQRLEAIGQAEWDGVWQLVLLQR